MNQLPKDTKNLPGGKDTAHRNNVLIIGDIMLDCYVSGCVTRVSPESSAPVFLAQDDVKMLGGAGNVFTNIAGLDAKPYILGVIGNDDEGIQIKRLLKQYGEKSTSLLVDDDRPTTLKTRYLNDKTHILRIDKESVAELSPSLEDKLLEEAYKLIPQMQAIVLSDYGKGVLTSNIITRVISAANKYKVPILVDPKKVDYSVYKGADYLTPNKKELSEATGGMPTDTDDEVVKAGLKLLTTTGVGAIIATRAQDGISLIRKDLEPLHLSSEAQTVVDVSGAGDTVVAAIAAALSEGTLIADAVRLANTAASIVVSKAGTTSIKKEDFTTLKTSSNIDLQHNNFFASPCCHVDQAKDFIQQWRSQGLKVGLTNGCFDIIHAGHVGYINQARKRCDRLIIAINADESVKRLKGKERPINKEEARALVLGSFRSVDLVVAFGYETQENDTPEILIDRLRPDIFFKGGDYTLDQLPEAKIVMSYGGHVEIMPLYDGHSTTGIIEKLKGKAAA